MDKPGHSTHCRCSACDCTHCRRPMRMSLCDGYFEREGRRILHDVNLTIDRGDFMAITGPNGGGKTTLLRLILGLLKPASGKIVYYDEQGNPSPHPRFGYLPQKNSIDSHFPITVREVVESALLPYSALSKAEKCKRVDEALDKIEMSPLQNRPIGKLSGGQLQRTLFARAIVSTPPVLVLDEPLSYLDKHFEQHLYRIIADMAPSTTIVLVSHEMSQIAGMANRHVIVDHTLHECVAEHHWTHSDCE